MTTQSPSAKAVVRSSLVQRLSRFVSLSSAEIEVLEDLQSTTRVVRHNREIITQGRRYGGLLVTIEGISVRYRILRDGRRQVLDIALPGDLIGFPACFFDSAPYSISALTDTVLACISLPVLAGLFKTQPRLAAAIFWSFASEAAIYIEHLTDVGRRSALERVAHFLLELLVRFQSIGRGDECSFPMPLTQELLADALGLSVQYVNQTIRQLREEGLVSIERQQVTIHDLEALTALADFERTYLSRFRIAEFAAENWPDAVTAES